MVELVGLEVFGEPSYARYGGFEAACAGPSPMLRQPTAQAINRAKLYKLPAEGSRAAKAVRRAGWHQVAQRRCDAADSGAKAHGSPKLICIHTRRFSPTQCHHHSSTQAHGWSTAGGETPARVTAIEFFGVPREL